ncbi:MAG: GDP-L-fucose synthase [Hyphomonadaceae bacterium]|nr:GDP-L-fucose synthase [Hyphomonadaceae bacterium]
MQGKRVWVAGHRGMVGAALVRRLEREGCTVLTTSRTETDLTTQADVDRYVASAKPQAIFMAAAKVGGILANDTYPAEFLYQNLMIAANVTQAAHANGVEKMLFLGSSCIYPKFAPQPMREDALLTGPLEPTNEWYAIAKIAGIKLAQSYRRQYGANYISAMPTNLYGPGDNFDLSSSHVIPAMIRKAHEAKLANAESFQIWGTGSAKREFLHVDDCADALVLLMRTYDGYEHVNVGYGEDVSIADVAQMVADAVGFKGAITKDASKPDGTPRKLMDISRLASMGWAPKIDLPTGLRDAYRWYLENRG